MNMFTYDEQERQAYIDRAPYLSLLHQAEEELLEGTLTVEEANALHGELDELRVLRESLEAPSEAYEWLIDRLVAYLRSHTGALTKKHLAAVADALDGFDPDIDECLLDRGVDAELRAAFFG